MASRWARKPSLLRKPANEKVPRLQNQLTPILNGRLIAKSAGSTGTTKPPGPSRVLRLIGLPGRLKEASLASPTAGRVGRLTGPRVAMRLGVLSAGRPRGASLAGLLAGRVNVNLLVGPAKRPAVRSDVRENQGAPLEDRANHALHRAGLENPDVLLADPANVLPREGSVRLRVRGFHVRLNGNRAGTINDLFLHRVSPAATLDRVTGLLGRSENPRVDPMDPLPQENLLKKNSGENSTRSRRKLPKSSIAF